MDIGKDKFMSDKKWTTVGRVVKRQDGSGDYIKLTRDVNLKAGAIVSLSDPRARLTDEQKASLESEGQVQLTTKTGKIYTLYDSVRFELSVPNA